MGLILTPHPESQPYPLKKDGQFRHLPMSRVLLPQHSVVFIGHAAALTPAGDGEAEAGDCDGHFGVCVDEIGRVGTGLF